MAKTQDNIRFWLCQGITRPGQADFIIKNITGELSQLSQNWEVMIGWINLGCIFMDIDFQ